MIVKLELHQNAFTGLYKKNYFSGFSGLLVRPLSGLLVRPH